MASTDGTEFVAENLPPMGYRVYTELTPAKAVKVENGLLENEYISISEDSDICGFSDQYYFARVFKQETGISPGKYKKRV